MHTIIHEDNATAHKHLEERSVSLIYIDPPFNTGVEKIRGGFSYQDSYEGNFTEYLVKTIKLYLPKLASNGSFFLHLDYREVHYLKVALDAVFGRNNFMNEIIWSYDYGGKPKTRWANKHDTILWYVMDRSNYCFNYSEIDRIPYMAPNLVGEEKAARGKVPTDVWWQTIVPTNSKEKTGYPTQKPIALLKRLIMVHSKPSDIILDFFAGSGTTAVAAKSLSRGSISIDSSAKAVELIRERLKDE